MPGENRSKYLLGIDIGTTNLKAVLYNDAGNEICTEQKEYETIQLSSDIAEQDADIWWSGLTNCLQAITSSLPDAAGKIACISVSCQTPSMLPVNISGEPLRPSIIWMDRRARKEYQNILSELGEKRYRELTGMGPDVSFWPPKLMWYKNNEPELFRDTHSILQPNGFINYRLTGILSMDRINARFTHCYDTISGNWSEELSGVLGINLKEILPPLFDCTEIIGHVTPAAAMETGLKEGTPVAAGCTDEYATMISFGLSEPGDAGEITGTSTLVFIAHNKPIFDAGSTQCASGFYGEIACILDAPISTTGASLKWFANTLGGMEQIESENAAKACTELWTISLRDHAPEAAGFCFFHI